MTLQDTITVRRNIAAPRKQLFDAFTTAESLSQWFAPSAEISLDVPTFDFTQGGAFHLRYTMPDGELKEVRGVYEEISPPERLVFTWEWAAPDPHADVPTRVEIAFTETTGTTEITLTHSQLPKNDAGHRHAEGWNGILDRLTASMSGEQIE